MNANIDEVWARLQRSPFRMKFHLNAKDRAYFDHKGAEMILSHARDFIDARLAPPFPANDGKQTPMRGHPAFVAQHATATCCRGCLAKWHGIARAKALNEDEKAYILRVIARWLQAETQS